MSDESIITVNVGGGPLGGANGYRRGEWDVEIDGVKYRFYASISHRLPLDEQRLALIEQVRCALRNDPESLKAQKSRPGPEKQYHETVTVRMTALERAQLRAAMAVWECNESEAIRRMIRENADVRS